ncbi:MAG: STELLO glycosyltransferase family protein [Bacteroidota bacterium]
MNLGKTSLIITTIGSLNRALQEYGIHCSKNGVEFIVVGDKKTKPELTELFSQYQKEKQFKGGYYTADQQQQLPFKITSVLPFNHYTRKNIGYILAIKNNAELIMETDDDNYPQENYHCKFSKKITGQLVSHIGWVNVYRYFTTEHIWPRGFPLDLVTKEVPKLGEVTSVYSPIQQYLANKNPDVDAVYRLVINKELDFNDLKQNVALDAYSWCPFNSQNTVWFKEVFPLLYLPSTCSFRMTDIFRSYIAQRILWTIDARLSFGNATVYQDRNEHSLIKDFQDEISGYLNDKKIISILTDLNLKNGKENIQENLLCCYNALVENNILKDEELPILNAWLEDLQ